jgi:DedD protein
VSVATDEAPRDPVPSTTAAPKTAPTAAPAPVVAVAPPKAEAAPPKAQPAPAPAPAPVAVAAPKAEASAGRFVVQVGAFAESAAVREARARVEKLGLTTYTQVVETPDGARTRVRLGPFATREEADKAAGKVKAAGLPASVLTL